MYVDARSRNVYRLPFSQTILSVSGSAARKSTLRCFARSATASPTLDANVPISSTAFSRDSSSSATRTASPGLPLSSRDTISSGRPSTPPAALISVTRELHALLVRLEKRREDLVAVELSEADRLRGDGSAAASAATRTARPATAEYGSSDLRSGVAKPLLSSEAALNGRTSLRRRLTGRSARLGGATEPERRSRSRQDVGRRRHASACRPAFRSHR